MLSNLFRTCLFVSSSWHILLKHLSSKTNHNKLLVTFKYVFVNYTAPCLQRLVRTDHLVCFLQIIKLCKKIAEYAFLLYTNTNVTKCHC